MQFDPKATPFWESARGGGPITDWQRSVERGQISAELAELEDDLMGIRIAITEARATSSGRRQRIGRMAKCRDEIEARILELRSKLYG